jgi:hypothetical protein
MDKIDVNALVEVHKKGLVTVERFRNGAVHLLGPIEVLSQIRDHLWRAHRLNATFVTKETITSTNHGVAVRARYGATPKEEHPAQVEVPTGRAPRIELHPSVVAPVHA